MEMKTKNLATKNKRNEKSDNSQLTEFDDVLRRMLSTPPPKPEPKKLESEQNKKTAG